MSWWTKLCYALLAITFWFGIGLGPLLHPLLYTLTPLQRYYLGTYMESSRYADEPGSTTEVRWIWKVRPAPPERQAEPRPEPKKKAKRGAGAQAAEPVPKLQYQLAGERDLAPKPVLDTVWNGSGALPLVLSAEAEREGWTGLERSYPYQAASAQLASDLRQEFFDGDAWGRFFVQPALAFAILVCFWMAVRSWVEGERKQHPWGRPLGAHELLWQKLLEPQLRRVLALPGRMRPRVIEAAVTPALPPPQPAAAPAPAVQAVPQEAAAESKAAFVWDESRGID